MSRKIITTEETEEDKKIDGTLRPQFLKDYIGQEKIKSTLKIFIDAAKSRGARHWIIFCSMDLRDSERRRSAGSSRTRWA